MTTSFVLLAAGQSSRMKSDKALLDFNGEPWIHHQISEILNSGEIDQIVVVDQIHKKTAYQQVLAEFKNITFVENPDPASAPADSLFLALKNANFPQGALVSPIDVPLKAGVISQLMASKSADSWIVKPSLQGHGGHPVWLSFQALEKFVQNPVRLDFFIRDLPKSVVQFVEVTDESTQLNLNTPGDWEKFLTRTSHSKN